MALTYRFYRALRTGSGTRTDPFANDLGRFVSADGTGADFWDFVGPGAWHAARYTLALAESAVHAAVDADGANLALSGELADLAAVADFLDGHAAINLAAGILAQFEADGVSTAWLAAQTTNRQMLNYLARTVVLLQDVQRVANADTISAFAQALGTRVNQLTVQVRNRVSAWMVGKGLDTAWITGTTTVRQILQFVLEGINWPALPLGPVGF